MLKVGTEFEKQLVPDRLLHPFTNFLFFPHIGGQQHMWRWTGFNMGLDLIVTFDDWHLSIKRSLNSSGSANEHEAVLSNHKKRHIYYRARYVLDCFFFKILISKNVQKKSFFVKSLFVIIF